MNHWVGKVEGDFNSCYSCMTCVEIMNMRQDPDEDSFPEGYVFEMLDKGDTPEELLLKLNGGIPKDCTKCDDCGCVYKPSDVYNYECPMCVRAKV